MIAAPRQANRLFGGVAFENLRGRAGAPVADAQKNRRSGFSKYWRRGWDSPTSRRLRSLLSAKQKTRRSGFF
jgi:hypothetical protein